MTGNSGVFGHDAYVDEEKRFFPTAIPNHHHQLRHQISSPAPNIIYFLDNTKIYCLNTKTKKKSLIDELPFAARCLTTGYGWLVAGGNLGTVGHVLAHRIPEGTLPDDDADLDGLSTPELEATIGRRFREGPLDLGLGGELVNSVTLSKMHCRRESGHMDTSVVVIITNNDSTTKIYALEERGLVWWREYDAPPNHATISPDGTLMFVVGDKEVGYIYKMSGFITDVGKVTFPQWVLLRKLQLHRPTASEEGKVAYFTTAWSDSGRLCATASEFGYASVFDVEKLRDPEQDPLVAVVPSTRPHIYPGAIRTMIFAPSPWDLLIWAEGSGRICVADLRSGLLLKQIVKLDPQDMADQRMEVPEPPLPITPPLIGDDMTREELLQMAHEFALPSRYPSVEPLSVDEQNILRLIRTTREQEWDVREAVLQRGNNVTAIGSGGYVRYVPPGRATSNAAMTAGRSQAPSRNNAAPSSSNRSAEAHQRRMGLLERGLALQTATHDLQEMRRRYLRQASPATTARLDWNTDNDPDDEFQRELELLSAEMNAPVDAARLRPSGGRQSPREVFDLIAQAPTVESRPAPSNRTRPDATAAGAAAAQPSSPRTLLSLMEADRAQARTRARRIETAALAQPRFQGIPERDDSLTSLGYTVRAREREQRRTAGDAAAATQEETDTIAARTSRGILARAGQRRRAAEARQQELVPPDGARAAALGIIGESATSSRFMRPDPVTQFERWGLAYSTNPRGIEIPPRQEWGVNIVGLAVSGDGRVLHVGTEEGIFELKMNYHSRKFWPAIAYR